MDPTLEQKSEAESSTNWWVPLGLLPKTCSCSIYTLRLCHVSEAPVKGLATPPHYAAWCSFSNTDSRRNINNA